MHLLFFVASIPTIMLLPLTFSPSPPLHSPPFSFLFFPLSLRLVLPQFLRLFLPHQSLVSLPNKCEIFPQSIYSLFAQLFSFRWLLLFPRLFRRNFCFLSQKRPKFGNFFGTGFQKGGRNEENKIASKENVG